MRSTMSSDGCLTRANWVTRQSGAVNGREIQLLRPPGDSRRKVAAKRMFALLLDGSPLANVHGLGVVVL